MEGPLDVLQSDRYAVTHKIKICEKYLRAGVRWTQSHLRNVHIDYREEFGTEELKVTMTVKVSELLELIRGEKPIVDKGKLRYR